MTTVAFEFIIRNMIFVDEFRRVFYLEYFGVIMAFHTGVGWDIPVPLDHIQVTLSTGDPFLNVSSVIETASPNVYVPLGLGMAGGAGTHSA